MSGAEAAVSFSLLGGFRRDGELQTGIRFREITGYVEERLHTIAQSAGSLPVKVTDFISASVASIGAERAERRRCADLCIGDRRLIMLQLAQQLAGDVFWISPHCTGCDARFDVRLRRTELPTKPAGNSFPHADVRIQGRKVRLRVPTGGDQEIRFGLDDDKAALELLRRCVVSIAGRRPDAEFVHSVCAQEVETIEEAIDAVAPDVGTVMRVCCPECDTEQTVSIDPYQCDLLNGDRLFREVHTLARNYHWRERDILALSRQRRHRYLRLIESAQGAHR